MYVCMGGSKGDERASASASPKASTQSVVCCMCGDQGMSKELFKCKACLIRSQHKYCSDLYPKAESYKTCNWCLREEASKSNNNMNMNIIMISSDQNSPISSSSNNTNTTTSSNSTGNGVTVSQYIGSNSINGSPAVKLHRAAFPSHLNNKPIKKQRLPERSPEDLSPTTARPTRHVHLRAKVRRYKLLEEVSS